MSVTHSLFSLLLHSLLITALVSLDKPSASHMAWVWGPQGFSPHVPQDSPLPNPCLQMVAHVGLLEALCGHTACRSAWPHPVILYVFDPMKTSRLLTPLTFSPLLPSPFSPWAAEQCWKKPHHVAHSFHLELALALCSSGAASVWPAVIPVRLLPA